MTTPDLKHTASRFYKPAALNLTIIPSNIGTEQNRAKSPTLQAVCPFTAQMEFTPISRSLYVKPRWLDSSMFWIKHKMVFLSLQ